MARFAVEDFVEAVRPHRFLYDRTQLDFKDVPKKEALWEVIGQQFGITGKAPTALPRVRACV